MLFKLFTTLSLLFGNYVMMLFSSFLISSVILKSCSPLKYVGWCSKRAMAWWLRKGIEHAQDVLH